MYTVDPAPVARRTLLGKLLAGPYIPLNTVLLARPCAAYTEQLLPNCYANQGAINFHIKGIKHQKEGQVTLI